MSLNVKIRIISLYNFVCHNFICVDRIFVSSINEKNFVSLKKFPNEKTLNFKIFEFTSLTQLKLNKKPKFFLKYKRSYQMNPTHIFFLSLYQKRRKNRSNEVGYHVVMKINPCLPIFCHLPPSIPHSSHCSCCCHNKPLSSNPLI